MAEEQTPISKVVSSGLEMNVDGSEGLRSSLAVDSPVINLELSEVSTGGGVSGGKVPDTGLTLAQTSNPSQALEERLRLPRGFASASVGSLFSTPSRTASPIITFSSSPGQVNSQKGTLSSVTTTVPLVTTSSCGTSGNVGHSLFQTSHTRKL